MLLSVGVVASVDCGDSIYRTPASHCETYISSTRAQEEYRWSDPNVETHDAFMILPWACVCFLTASLAHRAARVVRSE